MNTNKFTEKAQEAISSAQQIAENNNNTQLDVEHLLMALLDQSEGIVPQILVKLGVDPSQIKTQIKSELDRLPKAYGPVQLYMSPRLKRVFSAAHSEEERLKDEYVSTEHLLVATVHDQDTRAAGRVLKSHGGTKGR